MVKDISERAEYTDGTVPDAIDFMAVEMVRRAQKILASRRARLSFLPREVFGEPAWDMLLDLFISSHEDRPISVSSACIASGVPATTALRWLSMMEEHGLIERTSDHADRRRVYVAITDSACKAMYEWLLRTAD